MPALAVSVTLPPWQNVVGPPAVMPACGSGFTVTVVALDVALQPLLSVTVTLKEPEAETSIDCAVAPFDQRYELMPAGALSVTLPPWQNVVGPEGVIAADGAFTVTCRGEDVMLQPLASVTVTV